MLIEIEEQKSIEYVQEWFDFKDGVKLLIASIDKPSFQRSLELNGIQAEQELTGIKAVTDEGAVKAKLGFNRAVSHLLLGWVGLISKDKKPIEYSPLNAELICTSSKQSLEIIVFIMDKAQEIRNSKADEIVNEVGKSSSTTNKETSNGAKKKPQKSIKSSA
ncbi:hypothetical protein [Acinetobacter guillouiae]|uniref:hypothetical protein n=1 Tax=Acinetobacter guillouiae TaxID=106649 RepID=UPI0028D092A6|nr:hypothetical protein [Acinetobacter guillouiae]